MAAETDNAPAALDASIAFTRSGYDFTGLEHRRQRHRYRLQLTGPSIPFTRNATLYAQWTPDASYTVTFIANGGSGSMAAETDNAPTARGSTPSPVPATASPAGTPPPAARAAPTADGATYPFTANTPPSMPSGRPSLLHRDLQRQRRVRDHGRRDRQPPDGADAQRLHPFRLRLHGLEHHRRGTGSAYSDGATYPFTKRHPLCPVGARRPPTP